ncbi:MAG: hypothetical protein A2Y17_08815 [Clostridiales bacterium GWF2_38_85]|nr:MAG: hypothetical protein A2Y17_08815 [Clostridiales bacterium GWF2_38_85]HBL83703.1 hypothetical protein [Clostridiales bacterium]
MKSKKIIALVMLLLISSAMSSCIGDATIDIDSIPELTNTSSEVSEEYSEPDESTQPGYTDRPTCTEIVNITADRIVVAGKCEDGAVITITKGKEDVSVQSVGGYYITEVVLASSGINSLKMTAKVDGKEESIERVLSATYKATVSERPDDLSVMVGLNSQLFLKKTLKDYNGENLLSTTEIAKFKKMVNDNYDTIQAKRIADIASEMSKTEKKPDGMTDLEFMDYLKEQAAKNYTPIEIIYVLVPNAISVYPENVPAEFVTTTNTTKYKQIVRALNDDGINATIIDMSTVLTEHKDDGYELFNRTNSNWSDYAAYLAYVELLNVIDDRYPAAKARPLSDFNVDTKEVWGGDMAGYLYLNRELTKDTATILTPKSFSYSFTTGTFYKSDVDRTLNIDEKDTKYAIQIRRVIKTGKENMPNVVVYRDSTVTPIYNMLAERFSMTAFHTMDILTPRKMDIGLDPAPDYVVVFCSEDNLDLVLNSSMN